MQTSNCPCHLPSPTEEELATIPGDQPGTAIRIRMEPRRDGYVRLEQLAYNENIGWYTQKSFCIPGDLVSSVATQMRKADCLMQSASPRSDQHVNVPLEQAPRVLPFPKLPVDQTPRLAIKRNA